MPHLDTSKHNHQPRRTRGNATLLFAAASVIVGCITIFALSRPQIAGALALGTTEQPEAFTELYFNNSQNLPKTVVAGRPISFSYHITNREDIATTYHPQVMVMEGNQIRLIPQSPVILVNNQGQNVTVTFTAAQPNDKLEIFVQLPAQNDAIDFWSHS